MIHGPSLSDQQKPVSAIEDQIAVRQNDRRDRQALQAAHRKFENPQRNAAETPLEPGGNDEQENQHGTVY